MAFTLPTHFLFLLKYANFIGPRRAFLFSFLFGFFFKKGRNAVVVLHICTKSSIFLIFMNYFPCNPFFSLVLYRAKDIANSKKRKHGLFLLRYIVLIVMYPYEFFAAFLGGFYYITPWRWLLSFPYKNKVCATLVWLHGFGHFKAIIQNVCFPDRRACSLRKPPCVCLLLGWLHR